MAIIRQSIFDSNDSNTSLNAGFRVELADGSADEYVPVVQLDAGGISIGSVDANEPSISGAAAITPHDTNTTTAGRQILIDCTGAGNVKVKFSDASTLTIPVTVGLSILPWAVIQVFITGTTATATYANLL